VKNKLVDSISGLTLILRIPRCSLANLKKKKQSSKNKLFNFLYSVQTVTLDKKKSMETKHYKTTSIFNI